MAVGPASIYDISATRKRFDVNKQIAQLIPDASPFAVFMMRARKKVVDSEKFYWYDEEPAPWWTTFSTEDAALAYDANQIVLDDVAHISEKDILKITETGEQLFVSAVNRQSKTVTVSRGYGSTNAATIAKGDTPHYILKLGNAMEENSLAPETRVDQPTERYNVTQEIRTPFDGSLRGEKIALRTSESERKRLRRRKALEHRLELERTMLFGELKDDQPARRRTTRGIMSFVEEGGNVYDFQGNRGLTEEEFELVCEMAFQYGSDKKLLVACPRIISQINQISAGKLTTEVGQKTYGVRIQKYLSAHGELNIVVSKTFSHGYDGMGLIVDMGHIYYRPLVGCDTKLDINLQENDRHGWLDEYWTEFGVEVHLPKAHTLIKGVARDESV